MKIKLSHCYEHSIQLLQKYSEFFLFFNIIQRTIKTIVITFQILDSVASLFL